MNNKEYDFLIIGQGIAGSVLAYTLWQLGQRVMVVNQPEQYTCSRTAAGLFNPITGSKMHKTWQADVLFPFLHSFYPQMEKDLNAHFFHPMPIYRPFESIAQQNQWLADITDKQMQPFVRELVPQDEREHYEAWIHNDFGGIETKESGFVDTNTMLNAVQYFLQAQNAYITDIFEDKDLQIGDSGVAWKHIKAKKIVFCRGKDDANSLFWKELLPFRPAKGEILKIKLLTDLPLPRRVVNRGVWIVPQGDNIYKAGSTYEWADLSNTPTEQARATIVQKLQTLLKVPYEIIDHTAGVRPATADRRPFWKAHSQYANMFIFNGLGTKGISLAPYFAAQLCEKLREVM